MHRPVGARNLTELTRAVEWVDDPGAFGIEAYEVVLAFLGEDGVVGSSGTQARHEELVGPAVTFVLAFGRFGVGELAAHGEQQLAGLGRQPGRQLVVVLGHAARLPRSPPSPAANAVHSRPAHSPGERSATE